MFSPPGWKPAVRSGKGWEDFVTFDLHSVTRVTRVKMGMATTRRILKVMIQASNVPGIQQIPKRSPR